MNGTSLCRLSIRMDGDGLVLVDRGDGCGCPCHVRASFGEGNFPRTMRRLIYDLPRVLRSTEFRQALAEYHACTAGTTP